MVAATQGMAEMKSLESFQALYTDLETLSEGNLSDQLLERVGPQLDGLLEDFQRLLDKKPRNEESRKGLETGHLEISGDEYQINDEFQQGALRLADDLNLDELDAAHLFFQCQSETETAGRPAHTIAIIRFHQRRKWLLDCVRSILQIAADVDQDEDVRLGVQAFVDRLTGLGTAQGSPRYLVKCFAGMTDVKQWLQRLAEKVNTASILNQGQQADFVEMTEFQQVNLVTQHEILGLIAFYLVKLNHCKASDFDIIIDTLKKIDKYDNLLLHYFPPLAACIAKFGGSEGGGTMNDARNLHTKLCGQADHSTWSLSYLQAAFRAWWLAEYSGWYGENADGSIPENQLEDEAKQRSKLFTEALKDGAFDFLLCVSADSKSVEWHDPARQGLRQWLQRKTPVMLTSPFPFSTHFQEVLMEQLESFIEAFITNLPDVLRKLRTDEDEQRQLNKELNHDLDLERFLVIISFVFEGRPKAALEGFWDVRDGALMGFVQWASRRASTPLVTAFCEMLQSISEDELCATAAYEFLLDEGSQSSGRMRRSHSLSWNQIFKELNYFSSKIRDSPALPQAQSYRAGKPHADFVEFEPEQTLMLESYLRLITRLCTESGTARSFLAHHPTFRITELLFQLSSSDIGSRLRACAFTTLRSLVSHKTPETGEFLWNSMDLWVSGGYAPGFNMSKANFNMSVMGSPAGISAILKGLSSGFEEPDAFLQLLQALIIPCEGHSTLRDELPFPENLGIATRIPGIVPYIDFAIGQIFGSHLPEVGDIYQQRLLRLTSLEFIATCLGTFNEDLVIFASQSNVAVDLAIGASSLESYVLLHPFSRVMEWMYNDKVMTTLFAAIHQDPAEVGAAPSDSPLVLSLLKGIHVVSLILDLQPTYLDIIKPLIRSHPHLRRTPVPNAAFASFEDGVLSHLAILAELGLYCGSGHPDLVLASLKLLEKLSASSQLTAGPTSRDFSRGGHRNKALAALEDDAEAVSKILLREMEVKININQGPESPGYIIKLRILDFLISCLRSSPDLPTVAHLLLGFNCSDHTVSIESKSSFTRGISLFHTILSSVLDVSVVDDLGMASWIIKLGHKALQVLRELWSSPLTSDLVTLEMRSNDAFFMLFGQEEVIAPGIRWNGLEIMDQSFTTSPASSCLAEFLDRRAILLQYLSTELRQIVDSHSPTLKKRVFETLMGSTRLDDGQMRPHAAIFDYFDFMDPPIDENVRPTQLSLIQDLNFSSCLYQSDDSVSTANLGKMEELLLLRRAELLKTKFQEGSPEMVALNSQAQQLLEFHARDNSMKILYAARLNVLRAWVQLMLLMIEKGDFGRTSKTSIMLRTLQTIMPRLESNLDNVVEATELAKLAKSVIFSLDFDAQSFNHDEMGDLVSDKLFHLFQVSLKAINSLGSKTNLKQIFYTISYRYLTGMSDVRGISGLHSRHSIQTIKSAGDRFIDIVCDDAHASEFTTRIAALLILGALIAMAKNENSKYIIESLMRSNFVTILVGSIQNIPIDLRESSPENLDMTLSCCKARLAVLLQISQTRFGASTVLNAGLFHSIKESSLFSTDPDLGVDIAGPDALSKHYTLLVAIMRIICATLLSRGAQNQQTLEQGHKFLAENRLSILTVLKKSAGLGASVEVTEQIEELADAFMLLVTLTGFLETEEQKAPKKVSRTAFT
ncbi:nucleoporin Nup186/Nup192/Nup205 [Amylocarpus encephaloides]|uniref:Nucleoporin Nup186/Nup192/Nup205 n=1 Tax=Amylocarpus encephaloides TaxID=45428 RepID=A0A9P7YJP4_9HELO|nr:nucleoporin Nup186/Nup192/Nup205 [Amylocarpus encephaloides]